jgi:hypothetical protein
MGVFGCLYNRIWRIRNHENYSRVPDLKVGDSDPVDGIADVDDPENIFYPETESAFGEFNTEYVIDEVKYTIWRFFLY